jgi:hypothetical protein
MRRHMALAAIPACALIVFSPFSARAADPVTVPAPPGAASAVALQVGSLLDISKTSAIAQDSPSTAEASVIRIGGQTLLGLGGSQQGDGEKSGALLDTGANNPIRVEVAPWAAEVKETADPKKRNSKAEAALVRANVANVVKAALLHSKSEAEWTDLKSTGSAFSNGVELGVGNAISVVLLHSEVRTDGQGHSYLVGINGNEIGTDSQLGNSSFCSLTLPSVLSLSCLDASGGVGEAAPGEAREAAAQVAQVDPAIDAIKIIDPVGAFTTASSSGGGVAPVVTLPAAPAPAPLPAAEEARTPDAVAPAATLPRTGAALAGFTVFGLVALLGGALLRRVTN